MTRIRLSFRLQTASIFISVISLGVSSGLCQAIALPASTTIPVWFTHTVEAGKVKSGETITAKTMQAIVLTDGRKLSKGSLVVGHIVESKPFNFDATPYIKQNPSDLSIHFDKIVDHDQTIPVNLSMRALANANESYAASVPQYLDEPDSVGTRVLIGGDHFSPLSKEVLSADDDVVGYNRKQGVFAHLISSGDATFHCDGTETEQAVGIFSPSACGLYGFDTVYMQANGSTGNGTFSLVSKRHAVKLYAHSAALLQELPEHR